MASRFRVYFETQALGQERIDYELFDTPITHKWLAVLMDAHSKGLPIGKVSLQGKVLKTNRKNIEALFFAALEKVKPLLRIPFEKIDSKSLNNLQLQITTLIESFSTRPIKRDIQKALLDLNVLAKQLHIYCSTRDIDQQLDRHISFDYVESLELPVENSEYEWFTGENLFGDLLLGSGRMGKTIGDCYFNDDSEYIKSGLLRHRHAVGSQVILAFPSKKVPVGSYDKLKDKVIEWAIESGLEELGHSPKDPSIVNFQYAKLGEITTPLNGEDIDSLVKNGARILKTEIF